MTTRMTKGVVPPIAIPDLVKLLLPIKPAVENRSCWKANSMPTAASWCAVPSAYLKRQIGFCGKNEKEECGKQINFPIGNLATRKGAEHRRGNPQKFYGGVQLE